jgi:glycosyltransferase involved in cell wall biosynthesis/GT2 family glycosyltransferase
MAEVTDAARRPPIDVIVPVHGAGAVFRRCATSLAAHVDPARARVIVVVDGPDDPDIAAALADLAAGGLDLRIERERTQRGFVQSANRGMRLSDRDVVLLNSDTQVTAGWLDGLSAAAYSDARIATVTPFSNNATICSLPRFLAENTLPAGYDVNAFGALVARSARREYPRLPTGVGACLYIKRGVLHEIGLLDEAFGLGYGEEIDFCLRATARGYEHALDDATFIYHEGSRSFGTRRAARIRRAHRLLRSRYPGWWRTLAEFIARDPIAPARARVVDAMHAVRQASPLASASPLAGRRRRVLHVVHGWPPWAHGGTELYAYGLAIQQRDRHEVAVYARIADPDRLLGDVIEHDAGDVRVRLIVNNFTQRNPLCRSGFHCRRIAADFRALLDEVRPDVVHVHHLAGHCASLMTVARRRGLPIVYQVQDWWPLCARTNLVDRQGALCTGPAPAKCARCLPITGLPGATLGNPLLYAARHQWMRRQLACADAFIMGSRFIADSYQQTRLLPPNVPQHVLAYGVVEAAAEPPVDAAPRPLRFGYIGALLPHKGVHVAIEAFAAIEPEVARLHVWGVGDDVDYRKRLEASGRPPGVMFHGAFPESAKGDVLRSLDVLIVPSIGLESFGIAAREAMAHGVPVLASRLGALAELEGGELFEPADAAALARLVARIIAEPELLRRWRAALPRVKTVREHAEEIEQVYDEVIKRHAR